MRVRLKGMALVVALALAGVPANAAEIFTPVEDMTVRKSDSNLDNKYVRTYGYDAGFADSRGVVEFGLNESLSGKNVDSASLSFTEGQPGFSGRIDVFGFQGDGVVDNSDATMLDTRLGNVVNDDEVDGQRFELNVTSFLNDLAIADAEFAGIVFRSEDPADPLVGSLSICSSESPTFGGPQCSGNAVTPELTATLSDASTIPAPSTIALVLTGFVSLSMTLCARNQLLGRHT